MSTTRSGRPRSRQPADPPADAPRTLGDDLRARDDAALAALLRARPDLVHPVPTDLTGLAVRATTSPAVSRALDRLDRWTLQVAEVVAALAEPASPQQVRDALAEVDPARVDEALALLRVRALVWGGPTQVRLVRAVRDVFGPYPCGLDGPGTDAAPEGAAVLVEALLAEAPAAAREVVERLVWGSPAGRVAHADRPVTRATAETPVEWLLARALLVPRGPETVVLPRWASLALRSGRFLERPEPVAPALPAAGTVRDSTLVERTAGQHAFAAVRLVEDLLEAWAVDPPAQLRSGGLAVRDLTAAARILDVDEPTAALVVETARLCGLLASDDEEEPAWLPTPAYDIWAADSVPIRWAFLADGWLRSTRVAALVGAKDERGARVNALAPDTDRPAAADLRRLVLDVVDAMPPGVAARADDVRSALNFLRPRRATALRDLLVPATLLEAESLGLLGLGSMSTAGRALLHEGTAAAAAAVEAWLPEPLGHVLLQADLTAVAPGPLEIDLARELALVADVESTGAATVYRFRQSSVRRGLDAGRSGADILDLLGRVSRTPVPQPLTYLIDDVARRYGGVRVGLAQAYVRCDDDTTVASILAERGAAVLRPFRLAPTVLAAQAPVDEVLEVLRSLGYSPAAESPDGTVVVRRPDARRTRLRTPPPAVAGEPGAPDDLLLGAAVRAMRAGDRAYAAREAAAAAAAAQSAAEAGSDVAPGTGGRGPDQAAGAGSATGASAGTGVGAGRRASGAARAARGPAGLVPLATTSETLMALRRAIAAGASLWIGFADGDGRTVERVIDPVGLERGILTAFDHRDEQVRTFPVARITGTAPAAP